MIENPNPRNFYSPEEMSKRQEFIPVMKKRLLEKLEDLTNKIKEEEPFPHGDMSLDDLSEFDDAIDRILNNWYY
jgi:hypothetical protein